MNNAAKQKDVPTLHGTVRLPPFSAAAAFYSQAVIRLWTATDATRKSLQRVINTFLNNNLITCYKLNKLYIIHKPILMAFFDF